MRRFLSAILASAALFAFAIPVSADTAMSGMKMMKKCPTGQTMVKGYTKKDGTKVAGYCRASKSMMKGSSMKAMKMSPAPKATM